MMAEKRGLKLWRQFVIKQSYWEITPQPIKIYFLSAVSLEPK
jgi:hypothetical protein